jgi:flagellar basal body-associated protein FliL
MKNKNGLIIFISIVVGICAAVAATLVVVNYLKKKKAKLEATNYVFETDFDDEEQETVEE